MSGFRQSGADAPSGEAVSYSGARRAAGPQASEAACDDTNLAPACSERLDAVAEGAVALAEQFREQNCIRMRFKMMPGVHARLR